MCYSDVTTVPFEHIHFHDFFKLLPSVNFIFIEIVDDINQPCYESQSIQLIHFSLSFSVKMPRKTAVKPAPNAGVVRKVARHTSTVAAESELRKVK